MSAYIRAIEFVLPESVLTNEALAESFPEWSVEKIVSKTGIENRHIADKNQCASDLGVLAAEKVIKNYHIDRDTIDYLLLCTQSPDYLLPTTACILQDRMELSTSCGALDFNLGCSGFVYGLGLAKGLLETRQANEILLITADTYSKYINPRDKSVRTLFGDGAAAVIVSNNESTRNDLIGPFVYETDGRGSTNLIVPHGGHRNPINEASFINEQDENGNARSPSNLYMNGSEILAFTLKTVPALIRKLCVKSGVSIDAIDHFVFHQANKFILDQLRRKLNIDPSKFHESYRYYGNTVSSTIPIGLKDADEEGKFKSGDIIALVGFGVGYSSGATLIRWQA